MQVPVIVAAEDVVQHRGNPFLLLSPFAYAEITGSPVLASGHEVRDRLVQALIDGQPIPWTVTRVRSRLVLTHASGLTAVLEPGRQRPSPSETESSLYPADVTWDQKVLGTFPAPRLPGRPASGAEPG